jgi:hypothetical protein
MKSINSLVAADCVIAVSVRRDHQDSEYEEDEEEDNKHEDEGYDDEEEEEDQGEGYSVSNRRREFCFLQRRDRPDVVRCEYSPCDSIALEC